MKYIILIFTILVTLQLDAQRFSWGIPVKHDKLEFSGKAYINHFLLQENDNGLIRLRCQKNEVIAKESVFLEIYNADYELQKTVDVFLGTRINNDLEKIVVAKDKFYIFSAIAGQDMSNTLVVQTYNFDGEAIGEEKVLDKITETKALARGEFFIAASKDRNHFAVITIPIYQRKVNETIKVQTFDSGFRATFSENITLEYPRKRFLYNTPYIMNDGTVFMHKRQKIKKVGEVREMYVLNKDKKTLVANKLSMSNGNDFLMLDNTMLENEAGNFVYAGLYKKAGKMQAGQGVFYMEFDNTGKVVREVAHHFNNPPKLGFTGVKLKSVEFLPTGELLFVAHDFSSNSVTQGSDPNSRFYSYNCKTFYFMRIKGDELVWSNTIQREPIESNRDRGRLLDVAWMYDAEGDNVILLYNELQALYKNTRKQGVYKVPTMGYIDGKGEFDARPLLDSDLGKYDDSYTFCPDEFYQNGNYLILKCTNNIDFKLGRFSL